MCSSKYSRRNRISQNVKGARSTKGSKGETVSVLAPKFFWHIVGTLKNAIYSSLTESPIQNTEKDSFLHPTDMFLWSRWHFATEHIHCFRSRSPRLLDRFHISLPQMGQHSSQDTLYHCQTPEPFHSTEPWAVCFNLFFFRIKGFGLDCFSLLEGILARC